MGSADAERGFSIMNHVRTSRRSRLTPHHLDDIMRIRINGPKNIKQFPASHYANLWIKAGHLRTDDKAQIKKPKIDTILENDDSINKEYFHFPNSILF